MHGRACTCVCLLERHWLTAVTNFESQQTVHGADVRAFVCNEFCASAAMPAGSMKGQCLQAPWLFAALKAMPHAHSHSQWCAQIAADGSCQSVIVHSLNLQLVHDNWYFKEPPNGACPFIIINGSIMRLKCFGEIFYKMSLSWTQGRKQTVAGLADVVLASFSPEISAH